MTIQPLEYSLKLGTREILQICELDTDRFPILLAPNDALAAVMGRCTKAPRRVLETAKAGHSKPLEEFIGTPPVGSLLKVPAPGCHLLSDCSTAKPNECTLRFISTTGGRFPLCWTAGPGPYGEMIDIIVHAWRRKMYIIIVS